MAYTKIEIAGLVKGFGGRRVLDGLDLSVPAGAVVALLGPNGAGKTTTVRVLATLLRPDAGTVRVAGHDVAREPRAVRAVMSLTGQHATVDEPLTAEENLVLMARLRGLRGALVRRRAEELLEQFGLVEARDRRVATFSGGMRRRLDLAVSLIARPEVIVLDEPTTGLDPRSRRVMWEAVTALTDHGTTVLLTTQYLEEADRLADRIAVLDAGRVVAEGTAAELKARVGSDAVELRFADERPRAAAEVALARAGHRAVPAGDGLVLRVPTDGTADEVRRLLEALAGDHVPVERLDTRRPTLDDVFLALTA